MSKQVATVPDDPRGPEVPLMRLRSIHDLTQAQEWLWNKQTSGQIDAKTADALNTTLKGSIFLHAKLKLDAAKLWLNAHVKKIELPPGLLPE